MDQSQYALTFSDFKNSALNEEILSIGKSAPQNKQNVSNVGQFDFTQEVHDQEVEYYFNLLFSPKNMAESLIKRNQGLQIKCIIDSDSEPEELYNRRAKRVENLKQKENKNQNILKEIQSKDSQKYSAIAKFMQLFGQVKRKIQGIRHDYYSEKTFLALKRITTKQLKRITCILYQMLQKVLATQNNNVKRSADKQEVDERLVQFLIIPRFFISKQKLLKFLNNQFIQDSFRLLITYNCLGHYNNEANKKLPEQNHMRHIIELLQKPNGKEKFKKICSINHGSNFQKNYPQIYQELYGRELSCLKKIQKLTKGKFKQEQLLAILNQQQQSKQKKSFTISEKSHKLSKILSKKKSAMHIEINDFQSISIFLNSISKQRKEAPMTKSGSYANPNPDPSEESKNKVRRHQSLLTNQSQQHWALKVKKTLTLPQGDLKKTYQSNFVIVKPPRNSPEADQLI